MYWSYSFDYDWLISPDSEWLKSPDANITASIIVLSLNMVAFLPDSKAKVSIK